MDRTQLIVLVVIGAAGFSGIAVMMSSPICPMGLNQAEWELHGGVSEERHLTSGEVELDVQILLSGHASGTTIRDVTILFENSEGTVSQAVKVGTISGYTEMTKTVRLEQPPERIRLETGSIEKGNADAEYWIHGAKRSDGGYEQFTQEHQPC